LTPLPISSPPTTLPPTTLPSENPPQVVLPFPPASDGSTPPTLIASPATPAHPVPANLSQEVLLALAARPVGGVPGLSIRNDGVLSDRVVVQLPNTKMVEGLLRLVVLTQPSGFSGDVVSAVE